MPVPGVKAELSGSRNFQVGTGNIQVNIERPTPPERIVTGSIPQAPPAFQPREDLMAKLRDAGPGAPVVRAVIGMPGVGKTQLAAAYARECRAAGWRLIAWVNAEDTAGVLDGLSVVADRLGISAAGKTRQARALEVRNRLEETGGHCLVIFDNGSDLHALLPYVPSVGDVQVVITTTDMTATAVGRHIPVDVFTPQESVKFLAERAGRDDPAGAAELAAELGNLPLALAQAAAVIRDQRLSYAVYLRRVRAYPVAKYLPPARGEPYPRGAAEAILLSIDTVSADDPDHACTVLLGVLSLLAPDGVTRDLLLWTAGDLVRGLMFSARRRSRLFPLLRRRKRRKEGYSADDISERMDAALGQLASASLLTFSGDGSTVAVHRLVMRVARERLIGGGSMVWLGGIVRHQLLAYQSALEMDYLYNLSGRQRDRNDRTAEREFIRHVAAVAEHLAPYAANSDESQELRTLSSQAAAARNVLGDSASDAVVRAEERVTRSVGANGESHDETLNSREILARAYLEAGQAEEAIAQLERVLSGRERTLGAAAPETLATAGDLAREYIAVGRLDEAAPLLERWVSWQHSLRRIFVDEWHFISFYETAERASKAIPVLEMRLQVFGRVLGDADLYTQQDRISLASAYRKVGRMDEAIALYEYALRGIQSTYHEHRMNPAPVQSLLDAARREAAEPAGELRESQE